MLSISRMASKAPLRFALGVAIVSLSLPASHLQAQSLVGAVLTSNTSTGADATGGGYQYSTNSNTGTSGLLLTLNGNNYGKGISIPLAAGDNVFTFTDSAVTPGGFGGLELFLNSTGTSYNPAGGGRAGDLDVARDTGAVNPFFIPVNGTQVADYSSVSHTLAYNGATSFTTGGETVTVTAFSDNGSAQGGFTLHVAPAITATPEPGSLTLLTGFGLSSAAYLIRRRRK